MLTRRQLIKTGVCGGVLLAGAAYFGAPARELGSASNAHFGFLAAHDAALFAALAPVMLAVTPLDLPAVLCGVDRAIQALPLSLQAELRQLLDLLTNPWGRRWLAGVSNPWAWATPDEVATFLHAWQFSRFMLLKSGYQALHALVMAAWYGNPASWPALGYQRPESIVRLLS